MTTLVLHFDKQNKEIIIYNSNRHFHSSFTHTLLPFCFSKIFDCSWHFVLNQKSWKKNLITIWIKSKTNSWYKVLFLLNTSISWSTLYSVKFWLKFIQECNVRVGEKFVSRYIVAVSFIDHGRKLGSPDKTLLTTNWRLSCDRGHDNKTYAKQYHQNQIYKTIHSS